ncbi:Ja25 [Japanese cytomegalovirus]|nr:Ja25 [Japanese cytomegalovirus]
MIPLLGKWLKYVCIACLIILVNINHVTGVNCTNTKTKTGTVGTNITLTTTPVSNKGILYWYKPNCTTKDRLCDYSGYTGKNDVSDKTNVKFICLNNSSTLILINVTANQSGQYCSSTYSSNSFTYNCFNVTIKSILSTTPSPSSPSPPSSSPFLYTTPSHWRTTPQLQIPPGYATHTEKQDAAHIASILILLLLFVAIVILFFLKIPQKLWEKYYKRKTNITS